LIRLVEPDEVSPRAPILVMMGKFGGPAGHCLTGRGPDRRWGRCAAEGPSPVGRAFCHSVEAFMASASMQVAGHPDVPDTDLKGLSDPPDYRTFILLPAGLASASFGHLGPRGPAGERMTTYTLDRTDPPVDPAQAGSGLRVEAYPSRTRTGM